ncbi:MAG: biotin/lipoyl-binding protein [Fuerstiella sp.]
MRLHKSLLRLGWYSVVLFFGFSCLGCGRKASSSAEASLIELTDPDKLRVHVIQPQLTESAAKIVVCYGKFRPSTESRLEFGRPGVVSQLLKKVGDQVSEGDLIAELEQDDLDTKIADLEDSIKTTQDSLSVLPPDEVAQLTAKIGKLQGELKQLKGQAAVGRVTANMSGVVVKSNFMAGHLAVPGRHFLTVADKEDPVVDISLSDGLASTLKDSQSVWVGHNDTALMTSIQDRTPIDSEAGAERVTLKFRKPLAADRWDYDSAVEVRYRQPSNETGYWIPLTALHRSTDTGWHVLVAKQTLNEPDVSLLLNQPCDVLRQQNDEALIAGENLDDVWIVVDGSHRVVEGQAVVTVELLPDASGAFRPNGER